MNTIIHNDNSKSSMIQPSYASWLYDWQYLGHRSIPQNLYPWLFEKGSLTKRLCRHCKGAFSLRVIMQAQAQASPGEQCLLNLRSRQATLIRQVQLCFDGQAVVVGRSIIPSTTLQGNGRKLNGLLDNRPLGDLLFKDVNIQRGAIQIAKLKPCHREFQCVTTQYNCQVDHLWARRSVFKYLGKPILVSETFLPELAYVLR